MPFKGISSKWTPWLEGFIWVALGGALCIGGSRLGIGALDRPESGFMSLFTGSLLVLLGLFLTLSKAFWESEKKEAEKISGGTSQKARLYSILALILYASLLDLLGFLVATFLLLFFLFKILSPQKWLSPLFLSLMTVMLSYLLFHVWFRIDFPLGVFHIG
jgi:hypothetical protein